MDKYSLELSFLIVCLCDFSLNDTDVLSKKAAKFFYSFGMECVDCENLMIWLDKVP